MNTTAQQLANLEADTDEIEGVTISPAALVGLARHHREWTGWADATLVLDAPEAISPFAVTDLVSHVTTMDPRRLILNPNRVINNLTPFRLRQEAVITGTMLHEAAHARYTTWSPLTEAEQAAFKHSDGSEIRKETVKFARLCEEPRIEGLMARAIRDNVVPDAFGLDWTMRAASTHLLPLTEVSDNPAQAVMDVLTSWVLRAGRAIAIQHSIGTPPPAWTSKFTDLLYTTMVDHLAMRDDLPASPQVTASNVLRMVTEMMTWPGEAILNEHGMTVGHKATGPWMIDRAREVLDILFKADSDDGAGVPQMSGGCAAVGGGEPGESGDESDDQDSGEGQGQEWDEQAQDVAKAINDALNNIEGDADDEADEAGNDAKAKADQGPPPGSPVNTGKGGKDGGDGGGMFDGYAPRTPTIAEREQAKRAENFLRSLLDPTETSKRTLSESPAANIDPAAFAAWKAGGQVRDPHFFVRTRREVTSAPPVKIAILVDVSASMDDLQKPSAVLSWALASAAMDLRNFAGRGVQIESTMIHWGSGARVVLGNNEMPPGIRESPCNEMTNAMGQALALIETEIPGFLDEPEKPENRLLVQFTDWRLGGGHHETTRQMKRAMAAGVNMLTVFPDGGYSDYDRIMGGCKIQRGRHVKMVYDENKPEHVWTKAAELLRS